MKLGRREFLMGTGGVLAAPGVAGLIAGSGSVETAGIREDSLWTSEAPTTWNAPSYNSERKVDLAIIGGGYTGLACAYYAKLFRPDWSVIVLESHKLGSGASSRNSGALSAHQTGISDEEMLQRGFNRLRNFIDTDEIDCDLAAASILRLYQSKGAAQKARANMAHGGNWVSDDELRETTGSNYYAGGVNEPGFYNIQPAKLVAGHVSAALRVGAELFEQSPALSIRRGKPAEITTPNGNIRADQVLIATNAYTPRLGYFQGSMFPVHQYSFATRKLTTDEISSFGLQRWPTRFEDRSLPVTFSLTSSGHFFVRMVLGYASRNSCEWKDIAGAKKLAQRIFEQRYPGVADIGLTHGWRGVTGHTIKGGQIAGVIGDGNIHVSVAYNGLGIMASHNNGYLTACRMTDHADEDINYLTGVSGQIPFPADFYRSLMIKPVMKILTPV